MTEAVIVSCEHASNRIPAEFSRLFTGYEAVLASHRGWDPGALIFAGELAATLNAPLFSSEYSRLLVDLNRSRHHRELMSSVTRALPPAFREQILDQYYLPYRLRVEAAIAGLLARFGRAWHVSVHSFTPVLDGKVRQADLGILYDPA
ncbi:MAG: N-formylglutamate amidohydrolase, partial [Gammaproteobacteria bacterium]